MSASKKRLKVGVEIDEGELEEIWCLDAGDGKFVVDAIPQLACGISMGDTIHAAKNGGGLVAVEIVEKSGRCTLSAFPDAKHAKSLAARVKSLGGTSEQVDEEAVAIDLPNDDSLVLLCGWLDDEEIEYEVSDPLPEDDEDEIDEDEADDADDVE